MEAALYLDRKLRANCITARPASSGGQFSQLYAQEFRDLLDRQSSVQSYPQFICWRLPLLVQRGEYVQGPCVGLTELLKMGGFPAFKIDFQYLHGLEVNSAIERSKEISRLGVFLTKFEFTLWKQRDTATSGFVFHVENTNLSVIRKGSVICTNFLDLSPLASSQRIPPHGICRMTPMITNVSGGGTHFWPVFGDHGAWNFYSVCCQTT